MNDLHADPDRTRVFDLVHRKLTALGGTLMPAVRRRYRAASAKSMAAWRVLRARSKRALRF